MSPRSIASSLIREAPLLRADQDVASAVASVLESGLPALAVVDGDGRLAGIFGEREFMEALFPAYVKGLSSAAFVPRSIDSVIDKRQSCRTERVSQHMNTERIRVRTDFSDLQLAETFIHHRVLIIPVIDEGKQVVGLVTRSDFFAALGERFLQR
jgi:CBS domain-containing protein